MLLKMRVGLNVKKRRSMKIDFIFYYVHDYRRDGDKKLSN